MTPKPIVLPPTDMTPEEIAMVLLRPKRANAPASQPDDAPTESPARDDRGGIRLLRLEGAKRIAEGDFRYLRVEEEPDAPGFNRP